MPSFLFWNIAGTLNRQLVARAAVTSEADIVILAECKIEPSSLLTALNSDLSQYQYAAGQCEKLKFFTKFDPKFLRPHFESSRISARRLLLPARQELLLIAVHLPSKMHFSAESRSLECSELARLIESLELELGHRRTLLVGDLNMNPFEAGISASAGLHAVMAREIALRGSRTVQDKSYPFFYNPMWSHFGDRDNGPPGTYYYEKAEHLSFFWNMFDQVLLRPEALRGLGQDGIRILTSIGDERLLDDKGRPDKAKISDHLPILVELNF